MDISTLVHHYLWLIPVGLLVGSYGTLIGAGGGFVLMPLLLIAYPNDNVATLTSISLAVVCFNASSGSWAYARMKRIDYKSGIVFSLATTPGAILGALATMYIPRRQFDLVIGTLMVVTCIFLVMRPGKEAKPAHKHTRFHWIREIKEADGVTHAFSYHSLLGILWSVFVGFFSSLLGIGGGIIHVPVLVHMLNFPVHIATATSHFTLAFMALTGTITHVVSGTFHHGAMRTVFLGIGVLAGAQLGAHYSSRIHGDWIIRSLALALGFVGLRVLYSAL